MGRVDLLRQLCKSDRLHVTPATFNELRRAVDVGCEFSADPGGDPIGTGLDLIELRREELLTLNDLPQSLGAGEAESIAVCLRRAGTRLLTNDKRARNFSASTRFPAWTFPPSFADCGFGKS